MDRGSEENQLSLPSFRWLALCCIAALICLNAALRSQESSIRSKKVGGARGEWCAENFFHAAEMSGDQRFAWVSSQLRVFSSMFNVVMNVCTNISCLAPC